MHLKFATKILIENNKNPGDQDFSSINKEYPLAVYKRPKGINPCNSSIVISI